MKRLQYTSKGFTLIELLVVIAIIGILAAVTLASLNSAREKAKYARHQRLAKQLHIGMELYYQSNGYYNNTGITSSNCDVGGFNDTDANAIMEEWKASSGGLLGQLSCLSNNDSWAASVIVTAHDHSTSLCIDHTGDLVLYNGTQASIDSDEWVNNSVAQCDRS